MAEGHTWDEVSERIAGLYSRHLGQVATVLTPELEARIHISAEFVAFLTDIVINQPRGKEIHVIADNLSAHKSASA